MDFDIEFLGVLRKRPLMKFDSWAYTYVTHYHGKNTPIRNFPPSNGGWVYFIFDNDCLMYIGRAENLRRRLSSGHHIFDNRIHDVVFMFTGIFTKEAEKYNIREYWPPLNYNSGNQKKYREEVYGP